MDEGDELEQAPLCRAKSNSVLATERLLAAKGLNAEQSVGRILSPHHHYYKKCIDSSGKLRELISCAARAIRDNGSKWGVDLQPGCLADQLVAGLSQLERNPYA
eukprot:1155785-Pelagomonas_calceolata.AAC.3